MPRKHDAVDTDGFGRAEERPHVLRILERIEDENEGCLASFDRAGEDVVERRVPAWGDYQTDALVPVEPRKRRQGAAFDLDNWDPKVRRVEDDALERLAAVRNDEQPFRLAPSDERLFHRPASCD